MCFLAFQMTIGGLGIDNLFMLFMFLFCSLVQVYMISRYGQHLINAVSISVISALQFNSITNKYLQSESIGHAVYAHEWQNADIRYKKMLLLIIQRAQKPARLRATMVLNISLGTITDVSIKT